MKTAKTIGKAAVLALLVFTGLFAACQSTAGVKIGSDEAEDLAFEAFNRGYDLYEIGSYKEAITEFTKAIRFYSYFVFYENRGLAYYQMNQFDNALADFTQAIKLDPDYSYEAYAYRGHIYLLREEYSKALLDFNQGLEMDPQALKSLGPTMYLGRGLSYAFLGNYSEAINDFTFLINIGANDLILYISRGNCYFEIGDYDKASADAEIALQRDPGNEDARQLRSDIRAARAAQ